ncbi:hypothetical protein CO670_25405 [Rhizobium sp. J15]|uniref:hypothetical protein n=1 Tax=Rhizobium sp. J15 TaxID=2035450 RepID=UPI000BE9F36A|nr:hypothetical protein [Rhizobium sp. J15]PDT13964.1 hypothetical protein CO670_25405 [Rhizobium sp. J15]
MQKNNTSWVTVISIFLGTAVGTLVFLSSAALLVGNPISKSLASIHGILVKDRLSELSTEETATVYKLLRNGGLIDANSFLSSINGFYSTTVQILVSTFFVFGVISFFLIKQHSTNQVESAVDELTAKRFDIYLKSILFHELVRKEVSLASEIEAEAIQERLESIGDIAARLEEVESRLAAASDQEEQ